MIFSVSDLDPTIPHEILDHIAHLVSVQKYYLLAE